MYLIIFTYNIPDITLNLIVFIVVNRKFIYFFLVFLEDCVLLLVGFVWRTEKVDVFVFEQFVVDLRGEC